MKKSLFVFGFALLLSSSVFAQTTSIGQDVATRNFTATGTISAGGDIKAASNSYLSFGTTEGSAGYGIRDNAGTIQYKNISGVWAEFGGAVTELDPKVGTLTDTKWCTSDGSQVICSSDAPTSGWSQLNGNTSLMSGNLGIGVDVPTEALEFDVDGRILLTSSKTNLDESGVIRLKWANPQAKPAIIWLNENDERQAAIVTHEYLSYPDNLHKHISIETSNLLGELITRFEIPWGDDIVEIMTHSANLSIGAGGNLSVGSLAGANSIFRTFGDIYSYNNKSVGFGDKDWETTGMEAGAKWEFYRSTSTASLLVHQDDGTSEARIHLKKGAKDWELVNTDEFVIESEGVDRFRIDATGNIIVAGTTVHDSDIRYKTNITPIESSLEKISAITGVTYNWIDETKDQSTQIGVIAQDVEKVFPELVYEDADGYKSVAYSNLVAPLIEAVKEQQVQITSQDEEIAELRMMIEALQN